MGHVRPVTLQNETVFPLTKLRAPLFLRKRHVNFESFCAYEPPTTCEQP